jgi:DNA polymerase-3 subunit alpha
MSDFTYLRVHTHFSAGGGPASPAEWCRQAAALGYKALALADRGPLAGLNAFVDAARREELTPICGVELDVLLPTGDARRTEHISTPAVLFARDSVGLESLSRLCALAYAGWPSSEEAITWEALVEHSPGLVLVLLCEDATGAATALVDLAPKKLAEVGSALRAHYCDAAFLGLPHAGDAEASALSDQVASAAEHMGLPLVAMPVACYLKSDDALSYAALCSAREQAGWVGVRSQGSGVRSQEYLRSPDEAAALFSKWPLAVENVARIVEMCDKIQNSEFRIQNSDNSAALGRIAERRLLELLSVEELPVDVRDRLDTELVVVERYGRAQAWLALGSLVEVARSSRVPLGAPLGMADGALLSFALGLSSLNPMPYARPSWLSLRDEADSPTLPGIEVPSNRREMLVSALAKEYGAARIAHAACAVDITPIVAAQAAGAVLDVPGDVTRDILLRAMGKGWSAFDTGDPGMSDALQQSPDTIALSLRNAPLSFKPDPDTSLIMPELPDPKNKSGDDAAHPTTSQLRPVELGNGKGKWVPWTEEALCRLSYPAISLLPSQALDVLDRALALAAKHPVSGLPLSTLELSPTFEPDEGTGALITKGEVTGIPYITPKAAKGWNGGLTHEGLAALVAHSRTKSKVQNPKSNVQGMEGELLYRDQLDSLMEAVGMSPADATMLRRVLLKPDLDADGALPARFVEGCANSGMSEEEIDGLKAALLASAPGLGSRYAAHAWGRIAMWCATVKSAHPAALLAGALSAGWERGGRANVAALASEARRLGITLLPPDVSRSQAEHSLEREGTGWAILWGLASLPGWSTRQAAHLLEARPPQGISTVRDLCLAAARAELSLVQMETLVRSGGCDRLGGQHRDRQALTEAFPSMLEWAQASRSTTGQVDLFAASAASKPPVNDASTLATDPPSLGERQGYRTWEEANLGVAFTSAKEMDNLRLALDGAGDLRSRLLTSAQIQSEHVGKSIFLVGILSGVNLLGATGEVVGSSNAPPLAVAQVEDLEGSIELVAFPPNYKRHQRLWTEHNLVIVTARVCKHAEDGSLYLLCEQLAPFHGGEAEEELNLKVKTTRGGARPVDAPSGGTESAKASLADTQVMAVPKPAPASAPVPAVSRPQPTNGNGTGYSNGNGSGGIHAQPVTANGAPTYKLIITLPISDDDHTDIDRMIALNKLLMEHPGSDAVTLRIPYSPEPGAVTIGHLPRGTRYNSHLETRLRDLLGPDALAVIKLVG